MVFYRMYVYNIYQMHNMIDFADSYVFVQIYVKQVSYLKISLKDEYVY